MWRGWCEPSLFQPPEEPRPFAKLLGIWKGADFTYEEIKAAEYRFSEDDWE